ncbi:BnaA06g01210D [Brassica napus]|uniref:BnaA06g01210D protein n=1 Tax=Brassica napus TaxID=3708 RepID=A0A078GHM3_BRANA|nr:BnaA06g01210D [Brassica napus]
MTTSASMNPSLFRVICILHSVIALTSGTLMMFYTEKASIFGPGSEIASKLKGSTPHDELLIQISQEFHGFFAGGSVILYVLMASWRVLFEWKIEDLAYEWPKQALGDIALGISWVFFLVYSWREKYD